MAHDAQTFAASVQGYKTPAETAAANATDVTNARTKFESSEDQAEREFRVLAGQSPVKPTIDTLTPGTIVSGAGTHSVAVAGTNFIAGMKVLWDGVLLTPTGLTATACTVTPTKSATGKTVNVFAVNYDQELTATSEAVTFIYT